MTVPSFAERVIKTCLRVGEDDRVCIYTWRHMLDLAEALAIECRRAGADVHTEFTTDSMWYDSVINNSIDYLEAPDPFELTIAGVATAAIFISGPEDPARLKAVSADRWIAMARADRPFYEKFHERKVRMIQIGLGYVTPQRAKTYGFSYETWKKSVEEAVDVEYEKMQAIGRRMAKILQESREVKVTDSGGTDLSFMLEERKAHIYDGVIDDEDIETGSTYVNLPDGYVAVAPVEDSANGVLSSDVPFPNAGLLIQKMVFHFDKGRLASFDGDKNIDVLRNIWKRGTGDKDKIGWFSIGLNPRAQLGFTENYIVLGTATIGIGFNKELGGLNESDFAAGVTIAKPTVKLDGKTIIKQGELTP